MFDILSSPLSIVAALLYAGLGNHFWRTRWNAVDVPPLPLTSRPWERRAIAAALVLQGIGLYGGLFSGGGLRFSFSLAASLTLWLAVLIYCFISSMDGMQLMALPLAAFSALLPVIFPGTHEIVYAQDMSFRLHFLAAMLSYSLVTLSALHAVFMGFAEHKLRCDPRAQPDSLPSLLVMESLLFRMIGIAFLLLTLTLLSGLAFSEQLAGKAFVFGHKIFFTLSSWLIYAALLFGRHVYGWRGRVALRWTLVGFLLLFLAYIGSRFVLEVLLGRA